MGRDYGNPAEVEIYDSVHAGFRDVEAESNQVLDLLVLASSDVGSGTGHLPWLPRAAVPACMR
jgi:putative AdoMet-dependent methyltransferase